MIKYIRRIASLVFFFALLVSSLPGIATVCRRIGLNGFDEAGDHAHQLLPKNTSDPSQAAIYIENTAKGLYFQSNFITPGFDYPTKIGGENLSDVRLAFFNMLFTDPPSEQDRDAALESFRNNVQILLDKSVFTTGGYPLVDLKDARNVAVVNGEEGKVLTNGSVEVLNRSSPPPLVLSKVLGCCLYGIPPHLAAGYQKALEARPFDQSNVRFLSLVRDSGTEIAIDRTSTLKSLRLSPGRGIEDLSQIEQAFQQARGKTVVMISHVEGANFVVRDPAQQIVFSAPVESVRALAKQYQVELIDLGCRTAQEINDDHLAFGVTTQFNTAVAVESLERAIFGSRNYSEFLESLASQNLKIVVDAGFVQGWPLCADIYAQRRLSLFGMRHGGPLWIKLARIFVSFRNS